MFFLHSVHHVHSIKLNFKIVITVQMYNVSSGINYLMEDIFIHEGLISLYNVEMSG